MLVPHRVFSYESGKYENGHFLPDYVNYETGEYLRKQAEFLNSIIKNKIDYRVITDEDFCSGAAVIDDRGKREEIVNRSARKVSGLDMEAYSLACINNVLTAERKEVLVIKGIMDFAMDKNQSEEGGNKALAKTNSANFTLRLIKHLDVTIHSHLSQQEVRNEVSNEDYVQNQIEDKNGLLIESAVYGADGDTRDVLKKIKELFYLKKVSEIPVTNWLVDGPEPAHGKQKTLVLIYKIHGQGKISYVYENGFLKIDDLIKQAN